jgi:hypothetical protein
MVGDELRVAPLHEAVVMYRIVRGADRSAPTVLDSLRSPTTSAERRPRGYERRLAVIHMGLSVFSTQMAAEAMALRWPRIGMFIAELSLEPGRGFSLADTGQPGALDPVGSATAVARLDRRYPPCGGMNRALRDFR